ncbi:MAG: serine hydrolase [Planctomycetota bacterium]
MALLLTTRSFSRPRYRALLMAGCAIAAFLVSGLARPSLAAEATPIQPIFDKHVQPLLDGELVVGGVLGVRQGGETTVIGFGEVTRGGGQKPTAETIYEIGSISKAFTGTLLADMAERGEVGVDDPIQQHLPPGVTAPQQGDRPMTLAHLATHTSGLPRMPDNFAPADPTDPYADYTPELAYAFLQGHQLRRGPGESEYSNYGAGLLGTLLARKAGISYEELLVERIAEPLGMTDTRVALSEEQRTRFAPGYRSDLTSESEWNFDALVGAGGIRSTAPDMLKLAAAAWDEASPVHAALQSAFAQRGDMPGPGAIGLAWMIAGDGATRWHNGMTGGYTAAMFIHPPTKTAAVVLCNTAAEAPTVVCEKVLQSALGMDVEPIEAAPAVKVPAEVLAGYAGKYQLAPGLVITVRVEEGGLTVQLTGQPAFRLFAKSNTEFFLKVVDAQVTFDADAQGQASKLTLYQNGQVMPAPRVPE